MSNYPDDYTTTNAPDIERPFTNRNGKHVSEAATEDMLKLVEAALTASNTMLAAAWGLIDSQKLDCPGDILGGASDLTSDWLYCATGSQNADTLEGDLGIDVRSLEREHPAIMRTRKFFEAG